MQSGFKTEDAIAKDAGISQSVLSRIENGNYEPLMFRHLEKLSKVYGIDIEEIFKAL